MLKAPRPPFLYRYRPIDVGFPPLAEPRPEINGEPQEMGRLEALVKLGAHFFAHPSSFDDPFECRPQFQYDFSKSRTPSHIDNRIKQFDPQASPAKRLLFKAQARRAFGRPRYVESIVNKVVENIGVLCFVERPDNLLMWAHYADAHKGVCLEFDTSEWLFRLAGKVSYSQTYPIVDTASQSPSHLADTIFLTKSAEWAYEQEWRIVSQPGLSSLDLTVQALADALIGPGVHHMPLHLLRRIIFGVNASPENVALVRRWVREANLSVSFARCQIVPGEFRLKILNEK